MLNKKTIILGVTGGIAAYKAADLASKLIQSGASVRVIMTRNAQEFITPLTFEAITSSAVVTDMFQTAAEHRINHIALAEIADAILIAPATADIMAKLATGIADDMLTTTVLATRAPVILAPSMHTQMYQNPVTQENESRLKARGFYIIPPATGRLASGGYGPGRLPDTEVIIGHLKAVLGRSGDLAGMNIIVTAGGTQEPIDPVRVITNRSSGKMGYAIAEAARDRGARVTLISAPVSIPAPPVVDIIRVETAVQMKEAVQRAVSGADALIMAAAVADFQARDIAENKIKKEKGNLTLELTGTPDILAQLNGDFLKIGFAAESQDLLENARRKLIAKKLDLIVANNITEENSGFGSDTNKVTLIDKNGVVQNLPLLTKREVADRILDQVVRLLNLKRSSNNPAQKNTPA